MQHWIALKQMGLPTYQDLDEGKQGPGKIAIANNDFEYPSRKIAVNLVTVDPPK